MDKNKNIADKPVEKSRKLRNINARRHGAHSIIFIAIFIVFIVLINILATALSSRFPFSLDLTAEKKFTISEKNIEYIKNVSRPVTITLCATESGYTGADYFNEVVTTYKAIDASNGEYSMQAIKLLQEYAKTNSNITVNFSDPNEPGFADVAKRFPDNQISYGDILVESTFTLDGKEVNRKMILTYPDIFVLSAMEIEESYQLTGDYTSTYYTVEGSNVETAVTSAIYSVTSDKSIKATLLTAHSAANSMANFTDNITKNNYEIGELESLTTGTIPAESEFLIIAGPTSDFSEAELKKIDEFLDNGGEKGKTLMFFASTSSPDLPNLYEFLKEWGISFSSGTVFESNTSNMYQTQGGLAYKVNRTTSDFTKSLEKVNYDYWGRSAIPMKIVYETKQNRTVNILLVTNDTVFTWPANAGEDWTPTQSDVNGPYPYVTVTEEVVYRNNVEELKSHVIAFASMDFAATDWSKLASSVGNASLITGVMNSISGVQTDISFTSKTIGPTAFTPSGGAVTAILVIFAIALPILVLALSIVIWAIRRNR